MPALNWHPDALQDIERLYLFLADSSPQTANRAASTIRKAAQRLTENPRMGKPLSEFRQWPVRFGKRAYIIRYYIQDDGSLLIVRVWHSREYRTD